MYSVIPPSKNYPHEAAAKENPFPAQTTEENKK
jgi:hypothetical protein